MGSTFLGFLLLAGIAALSSPLGGVASILLRPSTLLLSIMAGLAGGVLLGAISFEMLPKALELADLLEVGVGFVIGVALVYGFDLFVNRGAIAGPEAEQIRRVRRFHSRHPPHGGKVTVLAGATSTEEVIEGIVIGVSAAIGGGMGLIVALAIAIDNISEAMSIGEMVWDEKDAKADRANEESNGKAGKGGRGKDGEGGQGGTKGDGAKGGRQQSLRIMGWTSLIGFSLIVSAIIGWLLLRSLPADWLGFLSAAGAGAIFYLSATSLLPEAESHQYQQSSGLSAATGFLGMLVLTEFT
jgi:zinc transporter, ZIP family